MPSRPGRGEGRGELPPGGRWIRAGSLAELRRAGRMRARIAGMDILLLAAEGEILACDNTCAHQRHARLHEGEVSGTTVRCPMHGWTYDARTGCSVTGEGRIAVYPVAVEGDDIFIGAG